jgi:hypothetical protein
MSEQQQSRAQVNISDSSARLLQKYKEQGQSATQTINYALAYYEYFQGQLEDGKVIQTFYPATGERHNVEFIL